MNWEKVKIQNKVIKEVLIEGDEVMFKTEDDISFRMYHNQDCCECVKIVKHDNVKELTGCTILDYQENIADVSEDSYDSATKTEFVFQTSKGVWTIEWLGESNGYYSESVNFEQQ